MVPTDKIENIQKVVLGTLFVFPESISTAIELLKPNYFDGENKKIFSTMIDLFNDGQQIDRISVYQKSKTNLKYLSSLEYYTDANLESHCLFLIEKSIKRDLNKLAGEIIESDTDVFELIESLQSGILEITQRGIRKQIHIKESVLKVIDQIEQTKQGKEVSFIKTGLIDLDYKLGGLKNGELIIIAARPSIGKTSLALKIAENVSNNHHVLFFSLEMTHEQLSTRVISAGSKIEFDHINSGKIKNEKLADFSKTAHKIMQLNFHLDDSSTQNITKIRSIAKRYKTENQIRLIVVDYLQLIDAKAYNREREIGIISHGLKSIAKELNIPVIVLSQLNRDCETKQDKKPELSNLRDSGSIEQDADVVLLLHRPEHYGIERYDDNVGSSTTNSAQVIIAKNRNGSTGELKLYFEKQFAKFGNYAEEIVREEVF
jgi:replicative DNA helicase